MNIGDTTLENIAFKWLLTSSLVKFKIKFYLKMYNGEVKLLFQSNK